MKTNTIQVFKEMVDDFYNSMPNETKKKMYDEHLKQLNKDAKIEDIIEMAYKNRNKGISI